MMKLSRKKFGLWPSFWIIMILSGVVAIVFQGSRGLYETTEGRYAESAWEMLARGNFLEPTLDFEPHWTKPPQTYWAIEGGLSLFGRNGWGARAYLVVAFCLTVVALYSIASLVWGREVAFYSALVYSTSFFPAYAANAVSSDMLLNMWEALVIWGFWAGIRSHKKFYFTLMWFFLGAAFLTKGPPGLILLLAIIPIYGWMRQKKWDLPSIFSISGFLLFITVGFGWYLYEAWLHPGLLTHWIKNEVAGRLLTGEYARNPQWYKAILIYWPVLIFGTLPWMGLIFLKRKHIPWPGREWLRLDYWSNKIEWSFVVLSILLPLIVFSLSKSKLPLYILPLFVPISLAIGRGLHGLVSNQKIRPSALKWITFFTLIIIVASKGVMANISSSKDMRQLSEKITAEMTSFPQSPLYYVGKDFLYGLEFYLNRQLTRVFIKEPEEPPPASTIPLDLLSEKLRRDHASGLHPFILLRNKDLPALSKVIPGIGSQGQVGRGNQNIEPPSSEQSPHQIKKLDSYWVLIVWRR